MDDTEIINTRGSVFVPVKNPSFKSLIKEKAGTLVFFSTALFSLQVEHT